MPRKPILWLLLLTLAALVGCGGDSSAKQEDPPEAEELPQRTDEGVAVAVLPTAVG